MRVKKSVHAGLNIQNAVNLEFKLTVSQQFQYLTWNQNFSQTKILGNQNICYKLLCVCTVYAQGTYKGHIYIKKIVIPNKDTPKLYIGLLIYYWLCLQPTPGWEIALWYNENMRSRLYFCFCPCQRDEFVRINLATERFKSSVFEKWLVCVTLH